MLRSKQVRIAQVVIVAIAMLTTSPVLATQLVYHPTNPNFGGNPNIYTFLLNEAQIQDDFGASGSGSGGSGGTTLGGTTIGNGPVIIINPPGVTSTGPTVNTGDTAP